MAQNLPKTAQSAKSRSSGRPAVLVATGIMLSKIAGLIRERALAHYLRDITGGGRFSGGSEDSQFSSESFRRRGTVGIVHPSLLAAPGSFR